MSAYGGAGDDALIGGASIPFGYTALGGGPVPDTLTGMDSEAMNTYLLGDEGPDMLRSGIGSDWLVGGSGDDVIVDLGGTDVIARGDGSADRAKAVGQAVGLREPE